MAIFNSYVKLPEGRFSHHPRCSRIICLKSRWRNSRFLHLRGCPSAFSCFICNHDETYGLSWLRRNTTYWKWRCKQQFHLNCGQLETCVTRQMVHHPHFWQKNKNGLYQHIKTWKCIAGFPMGRREKCPKKVNIKIMVFSWMIISKKNASNSNKNKKNN